MILGIGVDLVDMGRLQRLLDRFGDRFTERIFTKEERDFAEKASHPLRAYANRFAAKEAAVKALGTGMNRGVGWQDIEIHRLPSQAPSIVFHRKACELLESQVPEDHVSRLHVSFSDENPYSIAFVVLSAVFKKKS